MSSTGQRMNAESADNSYGVSIFAGVLVATLGAFEILQGFSAVLKDDVFVTGKDYSYAIDLTTWGWVNMLIGVILVLVGIGIVRGQTWANSAGIGLAVLSALSQFAFLPYYPFWSILIIAFDVVVIWALSTQIRRA